MQTLALPKRHEGYIAANFSLAVDGIDLMRRYADLFLLRRKFMLNYIARDQESTPTNS